MVSRNPAVSAAPVYRLAIACQGGGALTAFQAGVLGQLLAASRYDATGRRVLVDLPPLGDDIAGRDGRATYELVGLSGTSGGAMNAAICWTACNDGQPEDTAARLGRFWEAMVARPEDLGFTGMWFNLASLFCLDLLNGWWQPDFNPEDWPAAHQAQEAFTKLIRGHIPLPPPVAAGEGCRTALYVGAAEVRSGSFALFANNGATRGDDIAGPVTVEALTASAAIPWIYPAVELPLAKSMARTLQRAAARRLGESPGDAAARQDWQGLDVHRGAYWDGLFSENPPLWPFLRGHPSRHSKAQRILILRANPHVIPVAPRSAAEVDDRRNELEGNLSLEQEIRGIHAVNKCLALAGDQGSPALTKRYQRVEVFELDLPWSLHRGLRADAKMRRTPGFIHGLLQGGQGLGATFLAGATRAEQRTK